ncbi:hypothetical protein GA0061100_12610 [Rhizobium hainanense]|uniref:Uncharacterized protein n=1 Tax=Rhizobium hainanense TaxID=52131 RepID=A0A1C3WL55_9HYPH|nr:hypothetical protein GA0061100_12610 [Rhizobium hainanense]
MAAPLHFRGDQSQRKLRVEYPINRCGRRGELAFATSGISFGSFLMTFVRIMNARENDPLQRVLSSKLRGMQRDFGRRIEPSPSRPLNARQEASLAEIAQNRRIWKESALTVSFRRSPTQGRRRGGAAGRPVRRVSFHSTRQISPPILGENWRTARIYRRIPSTRKTDRHRKDHSGGNSRYLIPIDG